MRRLILILLIPSLASAIDVVQYESLKGQKDQQGNSVATLAQVPTGYVLITNRYDPNTGEKISMKSDVHPELIKQEIYVLQARIDKLKAFLAEIGQ